MKITFASVSLLYYCLTSPTTTAFAPLSTHRATATISPSSPSSSIITLFAQDDELVEELVREEIGKRRKWSNLRDAQGNDYAPWMKITAEEEERIRQLMIEKAAARRRRQEQEKDVKGALLKDSQGQELSGVGLRSRIIDGSVELEWATDSESKTQGFIIKRRPAKTNDFEVIASYENYGPLKSKGPDGGVYLYMDEDVPPGSWFYRVTERDDSGKENDLSQCLVEIQTPEEKMGSIIALAAFGIAAIGAVIAGTALDPVQY